MNALKITQNRVAILDMELVNKELPARPVLAKPLDEDGLKSFKWSVWGDDNLRPQQMALDIKTCGALTGIINLKSRLALCEGLVPAIIKSDDKGQRVIDKIISYQDDPEIWEFLEASDHFTQTAGWMKDIVGMGNAACRFMYNKEKNRIVAFQRDDITELRYEKRDDNGKIGQVYYCAEWQKIYTYDDSDKRVYSLPLLRRWAPWDHSKELAEAGKVEQVMTFRYPGWGEHYYSTPLWWSAYKWVKIAQAVPEMKATMFDNVMRPAWVVTIYPEFWSKQYENWESLSPEEKEGLKDATFTLIDEKLAGKNAAGKNVYVAGELSVEFGKGMAYIEFKSLENPIREGEMLPDAAAANSEIAFAEMMNLALIGGNQSAGPYTKNEGGSNIREGSLFQVVITELERRFIRHVMNVVKYVNGWHKIHPGLEFIIPATALTTLDTGAGSKPVMTGGIQPNNNPANNATD